jgi:ubiquinone/menaquinone biosynthesis C-methylase UbiE
MENNCCHQLYDTTFDRKRAESELKNYLRKGPRKDTRFLVEALRNLPLEGRSILDIGGGVGSIVFELFKSGIDRATHVELSSAYRQAFLDEVEQQHLTGRVSSRQGDFVELQDQIEPADLITLDKVICCYDNYVELVSRSVAKARKWYAYSIPRDVWWVRAVHWLGEQVKKLRGNTFKTYIHPSDKIEQLVVQAGFKKIGQRYQREWLMAVFEKES